MKKEIYLIVDPLGEFPLLADKIERALQAGLFAVQLWNNWRQPEKIQETVSAIYGLCQTHGVPLFLNGGAELLSINHIDGIHLDAPDERIELWKNTRPDLKWGLTCSNDPQQLQWAGEHGMDYVSFCSVFPSKTNTSCELISPESIRNTQRYFAGPVFLAGGIQISNLALLQGLPFDGIALVSGIMDAHDPGEAVNLFKKYLNSTHHEENIRR